MKSFASGKFDPIDIAVSCVELIGLLSGQELWDYVIMHPLYFAADGPFYNQMKRDVGLEHDKHCILPSFPDKVKTSSVCKFMTNNFQISLYYSIRFLTCHFEYF